MAIALSLGTSACYGVANFLAPLYTRRFPLLGVLLAGQVAALACTVIAAAASGESAPDATGVGLALLAGAGNALGLVGFLRATELGPVSIVAPIGATGAVLPVVYGVAGGEALEPVRAAGLGLAIAGVVLASRQRARDDGAPPRDLRACVAFALAGAAGFGVLLTALPKASAHGQWRALLDARGAIVVVLLALVAFSGRPARVAAGALPRLSVPGVLLLAGTVLYVLASERGQLSVVSVCASLNPAVTVALSLTLLGERLSRVQSTGIALAIAGVVLIAA